MMIPANIYDSYTTLSTSPQDANTDAHKKLIRHFEKFNHKPSTNRRAHCIAHTTVSLSLGLPIVNQNLKIRFLGTSYYICEADRSQIECKPGLGHASS